MPSLRSPRIKRNSNPLASASPNPSTSNHTKDTPKRYPTDNRSQTQLSTRRRGQTTPSAGNDDLFLTLANDDGTPTTPKEDPNRSQRRKVCWLSILSSISLSCATNDDSLFSLPSTVARPHLLKNMPRRPSFVNLKSLHHRA